VGNARREQPRSAVSWDRARAIFGNPRPPRQVWERQFDYNDEKLREMAGTPPERVDPSDLWYYHHDLAYVELQPDLFEYLFPVCLMDWHHTLMANTPCSHGDSEFHYGLHRGNVLETMLTPARREAVYEFFRDSFTSRLDAERGFLDLGSETPVHIWIGRFNSLGIVMPRIDLLWESWWGLDTPGRAVAALQYCSGLMYFEGENPLFAAWSKAHGGGGPYLWENDSMIYDAGWMGCNLDYLRSALTVAFVNDGVARAVTRLTGEPEWDRARRLVDDLPDRQEIITHRVAELPRLLASPSNLQGWSV
jgi:hypothetical protein